MPSFAQSIPAPSAATASLTRERLGKALRRGTSPAPAHTDHDVLELLRRRPVVAVPRRSLATVTSPEHSGIATRERPGRAERTLAYGCPSPGRLIRGGVLRVDACIARGVATRSGLIGVGLGGFRLVSGMFGTRRENHVEGVLAVLDLLVGYIGGYRRRAALRPGVGGALRPAVGHVTAPIASGPPWNGGLVWHLAYPLRPARRTGTGRAVPDTGDDVVGVDIPRHPLVARIR